MPAEAQEEDVSNPDTVIGDGTPESCTSDAFVEAVAQGGVITFECGPEPIVITLDQTAKVFNDQNPDVIIDGGGRVTLSGGGRVRILYQNTSDEAQVWTTSHCDDQDHPRLTVQNLKFVDGNAKSEADGGGAIFVRGGRFKVINSRFFNNVCHDVGSDVGGGAIFFVSDDQRGSLIIEDPVLENNPSGGFETDGYPGIFVLANGDPQVVNSTIE